MAGVASEAWTVSAIGRIHLERFAGADVEVARAVERFNSWPDAGWAGAAAGHPGDWVGPDIIWKTSEVIFVLLRHWSFKQDYLLEAHP